MQLSLVAIAKNYTYIGGKKKNMFIHEDFRAVTAICYNFQNCFSQFLHQYLIGDHHWEGSGFSKVETTGEDKKNINFED
jgi:hypothetical protein